jgi:RNA polymerase sigma-70 factor (ECF subfamily)
MDFSSKFAEVSSASPVVGSRRTTLKRVSEATRMALARLRITRCRNVPDRNRFQMRINDQGQRSHGNHENFDRVLNARVRAYFGGGFVEMRVLSSLRDSAGWESNPALELFPRKNKIDLDLEPFHCCVSTSQFLEKNARLALSRCKIADTRPCMNLPDATRDEEQQEPISGEVRISGEAQISGEGQATTLDPARRWELFLESRDRFTRLAFQLLGNAEDAQDLVQDVGLRVLRHPTGPRDGACFQAWCKGLLRNGAADFRRTTGRRPVELVGLGIDDYSARLTPVDPMLAVEQRTKLSKHLGDLDHDSRQVLMRRYVLGQTATEIASDLKSSPAGVRMKLKRLRTRLKRLLPKLAGVLALLPLDPFFI